MLVAVLLGGGVLLGLGAMVIDVGQLYQERAELQNGADAAALAVAKSCALGTCAAQPGTAQLRQRERQADGGGGGEPGLRLRHPRRPAPASTGALTDCPAPPPAGHQLRGRAHLHQDLPAARR